jgi:hypothetical protein
MTKLISFHCEAYVEDHPRDAATDIAVERAVTAALKKAGHKPKLVKSAWVECLPEKEVARLEGREPAWSDTPYDMLGQMSDSQAADVLTQYVMNQDSRDELLDFLREYVAHL